MQHKIPQGKHKMARQIPKQLEEKIIFSMSSKLARKVFTCNRLRGRQCGKSGIH
jgi:hypothetical protein